MGQRYGDDTKERIKESCDIVNLIEYYVPLKKAGQTYTGLCPFHDDHHAGNFHVYPDSQTFVCFAAGCEKRGDVFTFVEDMEMLDFRGALEFLAERTGVPLPKKRENKEIDELYEINKATCLFFQKQLQESDEAQEYLVKRNINEDSIYKFKIGYAQDSWESLSNHLASCMFEQRHIIKSGLLRESRRSSQPYDYFRGRIMFPFFSPSGRDILGFGGRILPALETDEAPKYLNTPETKLFNKSELLYGLNFASHSAREKKQLILTEGYTDVVLSHQYGIENIVATVGTALTDKHLEILSKRQDLELVSCFDGDEAGIKAAAKSAERVMLRPKSKVWILPDGKDPADLLEKGIDFREVLITNKPPFEFLVEYNSKDLDIETLEGKIALLEVMKEPLENVLESKRGICLETLAQQANISIDSARNYLGYDSENQLTQLKYDNLTTEGTQINFLRKLASSFSPEVVEHFQSHGLGINSFVEPAARALFAYLSNTEEAVSLFYSLMPLGKGKMFEQKVEEIKKVAGEEGIILTDLNTINLKRMLRHIPNHASSMQDLEVAYLRMKSREFANKLPDALARGKPASQLIKIISEADKKLKN